MHDESQVATGSPEHPSPQVSSGQVTLPVSTIAYGTEDGVLDDGAYAIPVPVDSRTLAELSEATGGIAYSAASSDELQDVYRDIGSSIGWRTEWREVTPFVAADLLKLARLVALPAIALWLPHSMMR